MSLLNLQAIRTQLSNAEPCVLAGRVTRASGIVVEAALPQVAVGTSCEIHATGNRMVAAEVVGFAGSQAILMPFGDVRGIGEGCPVVPRASAGEIVVGEALLGRVVDAAMRPLDGMPAPVLH
ncbi:MAG: EscN/YscN/HrcN family type III secretion system ATPase, partial [Polyangia bacterium]